MDSCRGPETEYVKMTSRCPKKKDWWRSAVFYQIYPRSFYDADNDGVGDLRGICEKLDYLNDGTGGGLGIDAIWISPFFPSPMKDFGYDVSDYCDVHPLFGTLEDFDALIEGAHARGIRVLIDLVFNHSSDRHPWFQESRSSRENAKADWYIWADPAEGGGPPNNWLSVFGGGAWEFDEGRGQYYMHSFLKEMPDLNWRNPEVREALADVVRFWMARGVDGFRLDAVDFYAKDEQLRDEPPREYATPDIDLADESNPWCGLARMYQANRPENIENLQFLRKVFDEGEDIVSIGEVGIILDLESYIKKAGEYCNRSDRLHMTYTFSLMAERPEAVMFTEVWELMRRTWADFPCWALGNHDTSRIASRYAHTPGLHRALLLLLLCMQGAPILYYGDELDMPQAELERDEIQDPFGKAFWPKYKGRDGCRIPFPWHNDAPNKAFCASAKPWLPIRDVQAFDEAEKDAQSTYHLVREMLALRKRHPALQFGWQEQIETTESVWLFTRKYYQGSIAESFLVAVNFSDVAVDYALSGDFAEMKDVRLESLGVKNGRNDDGVLKLPGAGFYLGRIG